MTDSLDPKALEAAAQALAKDDLTQYGRDTFDWQKDFAVSERAKYLTEASATIQAYLDAADLVAAPFFYASQEVVVDQIKQINDLTDERDEARREIEELQADIARHILIISDLEEER